MAAHKKESKISAALLARVAIVCAGLLAASCGRSGTAGAPADPQPGPGDLDNSVVLEGNQLQAVQIEPVGTYEFPVEKEAFGSVSFDEDPAVVQDESTLVGAAATFVLTTKELARARDLFASGNAVAQRELEQAISDQQTAAAALKAARDAVRADGKTDTEIDQMISAGSIDFGDATGGPTKWVLANVSEDDAPFIQLGQQVQVKVEAYPDRIFQGRISRIYATVDPNTHRIAVRCEVPDEKGELRSGMLATVAIRVQAPVTSTAIPENGVVREGDGTMTAWVTADRRRFLQRIIQVGMLERGRYQVLQGLRPGELAVTDGAVFLSNMLAAPPSD
jgi:cobalt-zinc-cadmium efflux system membrane fusion protein